MPHILSDSTIAANNAIENLRQQTTDKWNNRKYTESIIAIIDVMGIKKMFSGEPNFAKQMELYKSWEFIILTAQLAEVKQDLREKYGDFPIEYSMLSDSIVLSISLSSPNAFNRLMMYVRLIINSTLVEHTPPLMTRGAIVIGNIFQKDNIVFGPGLVEAHLIESKIAKDFRHIISKEHYNILLENADEDSKNMLIGYFRKDTDDYYRFDYLYSYLGYVDNRVIADPNGNAGISGRVTLNKIYNHVENEIKTNRDKRVVKKYKCMQAYFKKTMQYALYKTDSDEFNWFKESYAKRKRGDRQ